MVASSSSAMSFLALSLFMQELLRHFGVVAGASFFVGVCWFLYSAVWADRRRHGLRREPLASEAETDLRREVARGMADLERWLGAQPPRAEDPGGHA